MVIFFEFLFLISSVAYVILNGAFDIANTRSKQVQDILSKGHDFILHVKDENVKQLGSFHPRFNQPILEIMGQCFF